MNVLIDNSTYYSFKTAVQENWLDANVVYNMANFLECLVVADKVFLAPTTLWQPEPTDSDLFANDGPCLAMQTVASDESEVARIFKSAIDESTGDISNKLIRSSFTNSTNDLEKTKNLLHSWKKELGKDSSAFMETYSGIVDYTDTGTSKFFMDTFDTDRKSIPSFQKLAHYLLRTNVAMEMSKRLVYHPHSHRTPLVCEKMALKSRQSASLVAALIRSAEGVIEERLSEIAHTTILQPYRIFSSKNTNLPLILAVVLSGTRDPVDIIPRTMDLRNLPAAKTYRKWMAKLITSFRSNDKAQKIESAREILEAEQMLASELNKLYGTKNNTCSALVSKLASSVPDIEEFAAASVRSMLIKGGKGLAKSTPRVIGLFNNMRVRRKISLLINLAKTHKDVESLNSLLSRTFHKELEPEQLANLDSLRSNQAKLSAKLI